MIDREVSFSVGDLIDIHAALAAYISENERFLSSSVLRASRPLIESQNVRLRALLGRISAALAIDDVIERGAV